MLQRFNGRHLIITLAIVMPIVIAVELVDRFVVTPMIAERAAWIAMRTAAYEKGEAAMKSREFAEAVNHFREVKDLTLRSLGAHHPDAWWSFADLGLALERSGAPEEARQVYIEWLELIDGIKTNNHVQRARAFSGLTRASVFAGDYPSAIEFGEHTLKLFDGLSEPEELHRAYVLDHLAESYGKVGDFERAAAFRRRLLDEVDPDLLRKSGLRGVGRQAAQLALLEIRLGREEEAALIFEQSIEAYGQEPIGDPAYAGCMYIVNAFLLVKSAETERAWILVQAGKALLHEADEPEAYEVARFTMRRAAWMLVKRGEYHEAVRWLEVSEYLPRHNE